MDENDLVPDIAGPPPESLDDWKSPTIIINGITLSVEDYCKDPSFYNNYPIPQDYLCQVVNNLSTKTFHLFNIHIDPKVSTK